MEKGKAGECLFVGTGLRPGFYGDWSMAGRVDKRKSGPSIELQITTKRINVEYSR